MLVIRVVIEYDINSDYDIFSVENIPQSHLLPH